MGFSKIRYLFLLGAAGSAMAASAAGLVFSGNGKSVINDKPEASTGLNDIYVISDTRGVSASYTASSSSFAWLRYSNLGGGYAEEVAAARSGNTYTIELGQEDMGYIIEDGNSRYYCWIVNYANHELALDGIEIDSEQDCDRARLHLRGNAGKIAYYTINGQVKELGRELQVGYRTLMYDEDTEEYAQTDTQATLPSIDGAFSVPAPLCDTEFTVGGDRFLRAWGREESVSSPTFATISVEARTTAEQAERENDNEQKVESDGLGGSAPVDIHFHAAVTDAAIFREWQLARDSEFEDVIDRYQQLDLDYTFRENGTTYVRFVAANASASCESYGDVYTVFVGESALLCPNAFSPGASEGVNDEWKVSYKSLISFECHIFNRWGQEMKSMTNPAEGWDGKYKGKYVPAGAYYYVIVAEGSDGKKYKLSGDINIIKSRSNGNYSQPEGGEAGAE